MSFKGGQQKTTELTSDSQPITGYEDASNKPREGYYKGFDRRASSHAFSGKAKLIASVLDDSLSNLIASYLESYVKSHTEELKAIERLRGKLERGS